jgi:hypothetical protein
VQSMPRGLQTASDHGQPVFCLVKGWFRDWWQVLDSNKSGGFLVRGDTAQTAAD